MDKEALQAERESLKKRVESIDGSDLKALPEPDQRMFARQRAQMVERIDAITAELAED